MKNIYLPTILYPHKQIHYDIMRKQQSHRLQLQDAFQSLRNVVNLREFIITLTFTTISSSFHDFQGSLWFFQGLKIWQKNSRTSEEFARDLKTLHTTCQFCRCSIPQLHPLLWPFSSNALVGWFSQNTELSLSSCFRWEHVVSDIGF